MCQPNKFFEGKLVWVRSQEALAVIGHCCADSETRIAAEREYEERTAKERAGDYLMDELPRLAAARNRYVTCTGLVEAAQEAYISFKSKGGQFHAALRKALRVNGVLTVEEVVDDSAVRDLMGASQGASARTKTVNFGALTGQTALLAKLDLLKDWEAVGDALETFPNLASDAEIMDYLSGLDDAALTAAERNLRGALRAITDATGKAEDLIGFFTARNAQRITQWSSHSAAPMRMKTTLKPSRLANHQEFEIVGDNGRRLGLLLPVEYFKTGAVA